jgi:hypothetical protein
MTKVISPTVNGMIESAILSADSFEHAIDANRLVSATDIVDTPVTMLEARAFTDAHGKEFAACLIQLSDGVLRVFFAGTYAKVRPLAAARKNRLPMTMTLQARQTKNGHTLYLFDGV